MAHIAPHRWADLDAGRIDERERASIERHAAVCERCACERQRVLAARGAFEDIRAAEPPELGWDHIGARIYWVTSSERRAAQRDGGRHPSWRAVWITAAVACALSVAGLASARFFAARSSDAPVAKTARNDSEVQGHRAPPTADPAPPEPVLGVVTFVQGNVRARGEPIEIDRPLVAGDVIESETGRVAVQFGPDSGFELGPGSVLTVRAMDSTNIELAVEGVIDVDIERRPDGQRFSIVAGTRRVVVRGTAFRVDHRDGRLDVSCLRGRVEVTDGDASTDVIAGQRLVLALERIAEQRARDLAPDELEALDRSLSVPMLPAWTEPDALFATSATLEVRASPGQQVEVDGVRVGQGDLRLRVMSGRHKVEDTWVDLTAGAAAKTVVARRPGADHAIRKADRRARRKQLQRAISRSTRVHQCMRPLEKLDLVEGSFIEFDIGINADGSQGHLNILKSNVPPAAQRCLRDVVDRVSFSPGPRTELRYKLSF